MNQEGDRIIHSWPGIAEALGMSESTARRYHKEHPMPLKQVGGGGRVMIRKSDLSAWFDALPSAESTKEIISADMNADKR